MSTDPVGSPIYNLKEVIGKHLYYSHDDRFAIDFVFVLTLNGILKPLVDKFWGYIIGPASSGKTELIRIFLGHTKVTYVDDLTTNAYVSGASDEDGNDPSLLAELLGQMLWVKDLAATRSGDGASLTRFQGQLRGAHDQFYCKHSGTEGGRFYDSNHGFGAGTTPISDKEQRLDQQFGERKFNLYIARITMNHEQAKLHSRYVARYCIDKKANRQEINIAARTALNEAYAYSLANLDKWKLPTEAEDWLFDLCYLACRVRTASVEGHPAFAEMPGRMFSVLNTAAACWSFSRGTHEWLDSCKSFLSRIILDTLLPSTREILLAIWNVNNRSSQWATDKNIMKATTERFSEELIQQTLREFTDMSILQRDPIFHELDRYALTQTTDKLLEQSGMLEETPVPSFFRRSTQWPYNIATLNEEP